MKIKIIDKWNHELGTFEHKFEGPIVAVDNVKTSTNERVQLLAQTGNLKDVDVVIIVDQGF